eukprot:TRINITY_DN7785_c0_g1_i1.p1 TRINITY_DN7785_c0_g1~~TRINITY_DN7785_c0_g1_i1.p1  ORF type:complete len:482 (+),score=228.36 TRINITY_DN7785_c0_g1_i1:64-1509(+)
MSPPQFTIDNVNPNLIKAEYAVRGKIVLRAQEIAAEIKAAPEKHPFKKIIACNIGNPQELLQKPITYNRQVSALVTCPWLLSDAAAVADQCFREDVIARAKEIVDAIGHSHKTGAYTESQGYAWARASIARAIEKRDGGVPCDPKNLFLTDGASPGIKVILNMVVAGPDDAVMLPIPQYPLYSATLAVLDGHVAPYYLDEAKGWSLTSDELERSYAEATAAGKKVRAIVVINPGNPTGQVLSEECMTDICAFAAKHGLVLLADEVYQENIYADALKFSSFKKIVATQFPTLPCTSFHSISKGVMGECGKRGGYMEVCNVDEDVRGLIVKMVSINLCANVTGQILTELMMNPPQEGAASHPAWDEEYSGLKASLARRAKKLVEGINAIPKMVTNCIQGSMYAFPSMELPEHFVAKAAAKGVAPDFEWCWGLLEATGILVVPGSGFGQREGTFHFRITILPPEDEIADVVMGLKRYHESLWDA